MNSLYDDYKKFENLVNNWETLDIEDLNIDSFNPTTLVPLVCYLNGKDK